VRSFVLCSLERSVGAMRGHRRGGRGQGRASYGRYLKQVLRQTDGSMTLSKESILVLDSMMDDIFNRISNQASQLVYARRKKTLTDRDMDFAVKLIVPGDLGDHSMREGYRAVDSFATNLERRYSSLSLSSQANVIW